MEYKRLTVSILLHARCHVQVLHRLIDSECLDGDLKMYLCEYYDIH